MLEGDGVRGRMLHERVLERRMLNERVLEGRM